MSPIMDTKSLFSVFLLFLVCSQMDLYLAITVEINPETFNKDTGSTVDMTCKLDNSESDVKELMLLKIARKGERAIVLLHRNNTLTYSAGNKQEFPAKGNVANVVTDTTLKMTITTPDPEDSGAYTCTIYYINMQGSLKEHKASGYLTVEDPALQLLNITIKKLEEKVEQGNKDISSLKWRDTMDKVKLDDFDNRIDKQSEDIQALLQKDSDVDNKLKKMEERTKDQLKKMSDDIDTKSKTGTTKVANLESTVLHQAETIKDLTEKLAEFETTMQDMSKKVKKMEDNKSGGISDGTKDDIRNLKQTVELITNNVNDISDKVDENEDNVNKMTNAANVMAQKINDNLQQVSGIGTKLTDLEKETKKKLSKLTEDDLDNDFLNLQDKVKEHTKQIRDVTEKANEADEMGKKLKRVTELLAQQINDAKDDKSGTSKVQVAFHATSGVYGLFPKEKESLDFYEVTLNKGNGYDKETGVFTAPVAGIYAFNMFLQVPCFGCKIEVTIVANNKVLSKFTGGTQYTRDQHSISAVAKLDSGSKVEAVVIFKNSNANDKKWYLGVQEKCGFSGFLIAAS